MRRAARPLPLAFLLVLAATGSARALETSKHRFEVGGEIEAMRAADVDADGRPDLVLLVGGTTEDGARRQEVVVLRTPDAPDPATFWRAGDVTRIDVAAGPAAGAAAVALGRFGPEGEVRLRFLRADGLRDVTPAGGEVARQDLATLLGRSPGRELVFWDGVADLDGDGRDECWLPVAEDGGLVRVVPGSARQGGPGGLLDLALESRAASDAERLLVRSTWIPRLEAADLDGDGRRELVAWRGDALVAWSLSGPPTEGRIRPVWSVRLPFVRNDLGPNEVYTPRIRVTDADGDGVADLLVTLVTGRRDQIGSFRTRLLHYPGPFRDAETGRLVEPRVRIDTESVAMHIRYVDLDHDGALDYVTSSIRGSKLDLLQRVLGREPTIWHVGFLFDRGRGTWAQVPAFSVERPYSRDEAISNRFGRSGFFDGDFDGDGLADLLDLGNLGGIEILGAVRDHDEISFSARLMDRVRTPEPLVGDAVVTDLDGDGLSDAVLRSEGALYVVRPRRGGR